MFILALQANNTAKLEAVDQELQVVLSTIIVSWACLFKDGWFTYLTPSDHNYSVQAGSRSFYFDLYHIPVQVVLTTNNRSDGLRSDAESPASEAGLMFWGNYKQPGTGGSQEVLVWCDTN